MEIQKHLIVALAVLLASCTTVSVVPTSTSEVIATPPFTQTSVPSSTATPQLAATNTDVPYSAEPHLDSQFSEKLSALIINPHEIPPLDPNYPVLIEPEAQDLTSEIQNCSKDCVGVVWKSKDSKDVEGVGQRQVSIKLIRMDTDLQAAETASANWNEFSKIEPGMGFEEGTLIQSNILPSNSKVGIRYKEPEVEVIFIASRGPIYMMFTYYFQASGDLVSDFGSVQHLAVLQIKKLEEAGYPK